MSQAPVPAENAATAAPVVLRMQGISKRYGTLQANQDISLSLHAGEVLALLGENGAGKSTLMSVLFGQTVADQGRVELFGKPLPPGDTRSALNAGVGMVHQHFTLAHNLSVLDNVVLGTEPLWLPFSRRASAQARLLSVAQQAGLTVDPQALVADLSVGEQQRVEILKALYRGARVLVLDEPTAMLTPQESQSLFATLRQLVSQGLAVIFISHKLDEVMQVSQRVLVLRAGQVVARADTAATTPAELARWMVGNALPDLPVKTAHAPTADAAHAATPLPRLQVTGLSASGQRVRLQDVSFSLAAGEVLGIAGVSGNGQGLLAELLCGVARRSTGSMLLDGQPLARQATAIIAQGVARVPEDRQLVGVVGDLPVWENLCAEALRTPTLSRWGWVRRARAMAYAEQVVQSFDLRGAGLARPSRALSGGNMQKLVLGRVLQRADGQSPKLIVAHQPTWGLDIGAVGFVHGRLRAACAQGAAVLLISDDLDEIELLADRIAVICHGRLGPARPTADWTREQLGLAMAGAEAGADAGAEEMTTKQAHPHAT